MFTVDALALVATIAAATGALGLGLSSWKTCPANKVLVVRRKNSQELRIARQSTWCNPLTEQAAVLNLEAFDVKVSAMVPILLPRIGRLTSSIYIKLRIAVKPGEDDISLSQFSHSFAGLETHECASKLEELLVDLQVPPPLVPAQADKLKDEHLPNAREWRMWLADMLEPYGLDLQDWSILALSGAPGAESHIALDSRQGDQLESNISNALRYLVFGPVIEQIVVELPSQESTLGAVTVKWLLAVSANKDMDKFAVACDNFMAKTTEQTEAALAAVVSSAMHRALSASDGYKLIDRLCEAFKKSGAGDRSSGKELSVFILNAITDSATTWRGKLTMATVFLTSATTAQKFFTTLVNALENDLSAFGLKYEGLIFCDIDLQTAASTLPQKWNPGDLQSTPRYHTDFAASVQIAFAERLLTAVISARVEQRTTPVSEEAHEAASEVLAANLTAALSTPKATKLISSLEKIWVDVQRELEQIREQAEAQALRAPEDTDAISRYIINAAALRLVVPVLKFFFAILEGYAEVRNQFLKNCSQSTRASGGTIQKFALSDFDLLDEDGYSLFGTNESRVSFARETAAEAPSR